MVNFETGDETGDGSPPFASGILRLAKTTAPHLLGPEPRETSSELEFVELALHDLQNAVALLDASMRYLSADSIVESGESLPAVRDAQLAVRRIQRYIDHLVTSERVSRGAFGSRRRRVAVAPLLQDLVDEYGYHARAWGISLSLDLEKSQDLALFADDVLIRRVFQNLIENALRHNRRGSGRALVQARVDDWLELRFCNEGEPIPTEDRRRIFDKFVGNRRRGTAGVGLYFSRVAIVASGGTITVEDDPDWPVCIVVRLPADGLRIG
jgi:signal transduction histidine kinase